MKHLVCIGYLLRAARLGPANKAAQDRLPSIGTACNYMLYKLADFGESVGLYKFAGEMSFGPFVPCHGVAPTFGRDRQPHSGALRSKQVLPDAVLLVFLLS